MAEERDILRYDFQGETAGLEAAAQKVEAVLDRLQQKAAAPAGFATARSGLLIPSEIAEARQEQTRAVDQENTALTGLVTTQEKAVGVTADLIRNKQRLAAVVNLVGGSFGGAIGQVGGLLALLTTAGPTIAGVAAGLAGLALGVKVYEDLAGAAEKAAQAQERLNQAVAEGARERAKIAGGVAELLEPWGRRSDQNVRAAVEMRQQLQERFGAPEDLATKAAALAAGAGLGLDDALRLRVLLGRKAPIETPEQAREALRIARERGTSEALYAEGVGYGRDTSGVEARILAGAPGRGVLPGQDPERMAYGALSAQPGGFGANDLPADLSLGRFREMVEAARWLEQIETTLKTERQGYWLLTPEMRARRSKAERLVGPHRWLVDYVRSAGAVAGGGGAEGPAGFNAPETFDPYEWHRFMIHNLPGGEALETMLPPGAIEPRQETGRTVNIYNVHQTNQGTVYNARHNPLTYKIGEPRWGTSPMDIRNARPM